MEGLIFYWAILTGIKTKKMGTDAPFVDVVAIN